MGSPVHSRSSSPDPIADMGEFFTSHSPEKPQHKPVAIGRAYGRWHTNTDDFRDPKRYEGRAPRFIYINDFSDQTLPQTTPVVSAPQFTFPETRARAQSVDISLLPKVQKPHTTPAVSAHQFTYEASHTRVQSVFKKSIGNSTGSSSPRDLFEEVPSFKVGAPPQDDMKELRKKHLHALFND